MFDRKLKEIIKKQEGEIRNLECDISNLKKFGQENAQLKLDLSSLRSELITIKEKIREQTEADLFFISAKIQKELLEGKTKEEISPLHARQKALQQMAAQQGQSQYSGLSGFGQGIGNLLGR